MSNESIPQWEKIAIFVFGIIFISILLAMAYVDPNPTESTYATTKTILALSAAGIGAIIPGFIDIKMKGFLRAGGAMALFCIVYFFQPKQIITDIELPESKTVNVVNISANPAIKRWFDLIDSERYEIAWNQLATESKIRYPKDMFIEVFNQQRAPLGTTINRRSYSFRNLNISPEGVPGNFFHAVYITKFSNSKNQYYENVFLIYENNMWKVLWGNLVPDPNYTPQITNPTPKE